jgi:hypothetical protein
VRALVTALDGLDGVTATLDDGTGRINIVSADVRGTITVSDTSGALSLLGMAAGVYRATPGTRVETTTLKGTERVSNAREVNRLLSYAVSGLNESLRGLVDLDDMAPTSRDAVEATIRETLDALERAGVEGLSVQSRDGAVRLEVDAERLEASLRENAGALAKLFADRGAATEAIDALPDRLSSPTGPLADPAPEGARPVDHLQELRTQIASTALERDIAKTSTLLGSSVRILSPDLASRDRAGRSYSKMQELFESSAKLSFRATLMSS